MHDAKSLLTIQYPEVRLRRYLRICVVTSVIIELNISVFGEFSKIYSFTLCAKHFLFVGQTFVISNTVIFIYLYMYNIYSALYTQLNML